MQDSALIESIYEAALIPERWTDVLQALARGAGGVSGAILIYDGDQQPRWCGTPFIEEVLEQYCTTDAWRRTELTPYMLNVPVGTFFYDADFFPIDLLERDEMRAPLYKIGIGNQIGTMIHMPSGENVVITVERAIGMPRPQAGILRNLEAYRPHLARASLMSARLGLERAQNAVSVLAVLGLPSAVITANGRVIAANALMEALEGPMVFAAHGRLALSDRAPNELFQQALDDTIRHPGVIRSIPVQAQNGRPAFIAHVLPIEGNVRDIFSNSSRLVIITPVEHGIAPDGAMLAGLFDLTPAEARVAGLLMQGETVGEIAALLGVAVTTLRSQLRSIFEKTGTTRQAELTGLLATVGAMPGTRKVNSSSN